MTSLPYSPLALSNDHRPLPGLGVVLAVVTAAALLFLLFAGRGFGWSDQPAVPATPQDSYLQQAAQVLAQEQRLITTANALLTQNETNPTLSESPEWLASHEQVTAQLEAMGVYVQSMTAPANHAPLQACLADSTRLIATSQRFFQTAFTMGGHGAYYYSAHANWDYNLGKQELARCQAMGR